MKKKIITIVAFSVVLLTLGRAIIGWYLPDILEYPHVPKERILYEYKKNKLLFSDIAITLSRYNKYIAVDSDSREGNNYIIWRESDKENTLGSESKISDELLNSNLSTLFVKLKYKGIDKTENGIYFLRQTDIGFEQGIAFSLDGNKPNWPLINVLEPIEGNWYYYESK